MSRGNNRVPWPICSTRLGDDWIDDGTLCRTKSAPPGPAVVVSANPAKAGFDSAHGYSLAPEARRKRAIDIEIIGGDYTKSGDVRINNENYLKKLIEIGLGGKQKVLSKAQDMQFFIVRGGGEGFLSDALRKINACKNVTHWPLTNGKFGETDFNENDLLAVFNTDGTLIGSARLRRPTYVECRISRSTTAKVYATWAGKRVFIYRNATPGWIPYLGLALDDRFRDGSANNGNKMKIDLDKEEQKNGCIFIVYGKPPAVGTPELRPFEPALIKNILVAKGLDEAKLAKGRVSLGTMHVVTITL